MTTVAESKRKAFSNPLDLVAHIANTKDIKEEMVEVPEWDVEILMMGLTAEERNAILQANMNIKTGQPDMVNAYIDMVIASAHHPETHKKLFSTAHRGMLNSKNSAAIDRLTEAATRLSGLGQPALESATKN